MTKNIDLERLQDHVEEALVHYGLTPVEFSRLTGVNQTLVSHILNGRRKDVSTKHLKKMLPWLTLQADKVTASAHA